MATRQYIGARYVPIIMGEWDAETAYEPLSVVLYNNASYTSKKAVPAGITPTTAEFWALTGNYNAQIDAWSEEFTNYKETAIRQLPSVVDMAGNMSVTLGDVIRTLGYYEANDGGGALYLVRLALNTDIYSEQTDGSTSETGLVRLAANYDGAVLVAELILDSVMTPEQFGAHGDGATDDTKAIQTACDLASCVNFANKTYIVKTSNAAESYAIRLNKNIVLRGNHATVKTDSAVKIGAIFKTVDAFKIVISDFNFVGECSNETDDESGLTAITLTAATGFITGCTFDGFNKNIELTNCENFLVVGNTIKNATETLQKINGYGVLIEGGSDISIEANTFENIERHAVYINETKNIKVFGNDISGQTDDLARYSHYEGNIKIDGSENVFIRNNTISGNYYGIMFLPGFTSDLGGRNVYIENNTISGVIVNSGNAWGAVGTSTFANIILENIFINNNTIIAPDSDPAVNGIFFDAGIISGLHICDNVIKKFTRGIRLRHCETQIELSNNTVESCATGFDILDAVRLMLIGRINYYKDCATPVTTSEISLADSYAGILPAETMPVVLSGDSLTVDAFASTTFVASTPTTIATIKNGYDGQEIMFRSGANGAPTIRTASVTNIILTADFTPLSGDFILLRKSGVNWYEVARRMTY